MKKIPILLLLMLITIFITPTKLQAEVTLEPLEKSDQSGYVTYRNTTTQVMIPTEYTIQQTDFRAVWVSPLVGDIGLYTNDDVFKNELIGVLNTIEKYNMNVVVFHIRIMHDALYDSSINMKSSYVSGANFTRWDYLEWFIGECHRRGIEFHAWLNPYRITNSSTTVSAITSKYAKYPTNPASKTENIIIGNSGAILNPGEPAVRNFLVATCMEVIQKYDVDAIHFDDYFYSSMPSNADATTYNKYKSSSLTTNIYDWRREQIDLFIQQLSQAMRNFNQSSNRRVQLGIAPTGIWRNGNGSVTYDGEGNAITTGSNTAGQEHYSSYLYCNTKKWVDLEWIDYIIPQSYWSFELKAAPYADVVDWWAKVVKYKKVNLYTGMGFYRLYTGDSGGSWETNMMEAANQVLYNTKHEEIQGVCIFNYEYMKYAKTNPGMAKVLNDYWTTPAITPVVRTMSPIIPTPVGALTLTRIDDEQVILSWNPVLNARKYVVYRSTGAIDTTDPEQIVGIVGVNKNQDCLFSDIVEVNANYAVVSVSASGHTADASFITTSQATTEVPFNIGILYHPYLVGSVYPNSSVQINFPEADVFVGSAMTYVVQGSYDQEQWFDLEGRLRSNNNSFSFFFTYPKIIQPMYVRIVGTNDFGALESDEILLKINLQSLSEILKFVNDFFTMQLTNIITSLPQE